VGARASKRDRQIRRRAFHVAIALILVVCALSPFLETAVNWNDSVFATGYDGESTMAVLVLLLELVISLAGLLVCFCRNTQWIERIVITPSPFASKSDFSITIAELSPPPPLRI
jgi:hypothetical protein